MPSQTPQKKSLYNRRKYWYHVSTTLKGKHIRLIPWGEDEASNRSGDEPRGKRICVAPTVEQCITAIPYYMATVCTIYRTKSPVEAHRPKNVFDSRVTNEGWLKHPTNFVKIGILKFQDVERGIGVKDVISEAASSDDIKYSKEVLAWWKKAKIKRFIKRA